MKQNRSERPASRLQEGSGGGPDEQASDRQDEGIRSMSSGMGRDRLRRWDEEGYGDGVEAEHRECTKESHHGVG